MVSVSFKTDPDFPDIPANGPLGCPHIIDMASFTPDSTDYSLYDAVIKVSAEESQETSSSAEFKACAVSG